MFIKYLINYCLTWTLLDVFQKFSSSELAKFFLLHGPQNLGRDFRKSCSNFCNSLSIRACSLFNCSSLVSSCVSSL